MLPSGRPAAVAVAFGLSSAIIVSLVAKVQRLTDMQRICF